MTVILWFSSNLVVKSCMTLATPWTVVCQAPLSMGLSRQEYWSGLPFPSPSYPVLVSISYVKEEMLLHKIT